MEVESRTGIRFCLVRYVIDVRPNETTKNNRVVSLFAGFLEKGLQHNKSTGVLYYY